MSPSGAYGSDGDGKGGNLYSCTGGLSCTTLQDGVTGRPKRGKGSLQQNWRCERLGWGGRSGGLHVERHLQLGF